MPSSSSSSNNNNNNTTTTTATTNTGNASASTGMPAQTISAEAKREAAQQRLHQHDEGIKNRMQEDPKGYQVRQGALLDRSRDKFAYDGTKIKQEDDLDDE